MPRKPPPNKIDWTADQLNLLKTNWAKLDNRGLANLLGLGLTSVRTKCYELGLLRMQLEYWTKAQINFLLKNYKTRGDVELTEIFNKKWKKEKGWTKKHIEKKRKYLKLNRTKRQVKAIHDRNVKRGLFKDCPRARWRMQGVFPEGTVRIWKNMLGRFKVIKIGGVYVHYAHWLYEQHFGKMKRGYVVGFKDRDNMNVVIENLEQISRAEHARRNSTGRKKYPEDLRETIKALRELNKLINNKRHETGK